MADALKGIETDEFKHCLERWKRRLDRGTASDGERFEGD